MTVNTARLEHQIDFGESLRYRHLDTRSFRRCDSDIAIAAGQADKDSSVSPSSGESPGPEKEVDEDGEPTVCRRQLVWRQIATMDPSPDDPSNLNLAAGAVSSPSVQLCATNLPSPPPTEREFDESSVAPTPVPEALTSLTGGSKPATSFKVRVPTLDLQQLSRGAVIVHHSSSDSADSYHRNHHQNHNTGANHHVYVDPSMDPTGCIVSPQHLSAPLGDGLQHPVGFDHLPPVNCGTAERSLSRQSATMPFISDGAYSRNVGVAGGYRNGNPTDTSGVGSHLSTEATSAAFPAVDEDDPSALPLPLVPPLYEATSSAYDLTSFRPSVDSEDTLSSPSRVPPPPDPFGANCFLPCAAEMDRLRAGSSTVAYPFVHPASAAGTAPAPNSIFLPQSFVTTNHPRHCNLLFAQTPQPSEPILPSTVQPPFSAIPPAGAQSGAVIHRYSSSAHTVVTAASSCSQNHRPTAKIPWFQAASGLGTYVTNNPASGPGSGYTISPQDSLIWDISPDYSLSAAPTRRSCTRDTAAPSAPSLAVAATMVGAPSTALQGSSNGNVPGTRATTAGSYAGIGGTTSPAAIDFSRIKDHVSIVDSTTVYGQSDTGTSTTLKDPLRLPAGLRSLSVSNSAGSDSHQSPSFHCVTEACDHPLLVDSSTKHDGERHRADSEQQSPGSIRHAACLVRPLPSIGATESIGTFYSMMSCVSSPPPGAARPGSTAAFPLDQPFATARDYTGNHHFSAPAGSVSVEFSTEWSPGWGDFVMKRSKTNALADFCAVKQDSGFKLPSIAETTALWVQRLGATVASFAGSVGHKSAGTGVPGAHDKDEAQPGLVSRSIQPPPREIGPTHSLETVPTAAGHHRGLQRTAGTATPVILPVTSHASRLAARKWVRCPHPVVASRNSRRHGHKSRRNGSATGQNRQQPYVVDEVPTPPTGTQSFMVLFKQEPLISGKRRHRLYVHYRRHVLQHQRRKAGSVPAGATTGVYSDDDRFSAQNSGRRRAAWPRSRTSPHSRPKPRAKRTAWSLLSDSRHAAKQRRQKAAIGTSAYGSVIEGSTSDHHHHRLHNLVRHRHPHCSTRGLSPSRLLPAELGSADIRELTNRVMGPNLSAETRLVGDYSDSVVPGSGTVSNVALSSDTPVMFAGMHWSDVVVGRPDIDGFGFLSNQSSQGQGPDFITSPIATSPRQMKTEDAREPHMAKPLSARLSWAAEPRGGNSPQSGSDCWDLAVAAANAAAADEDDAETAAKEWQVRPLIDVAMSPYPTTQPDGDGTPLNPSTDTHGDGWLRNRWRHRQPTDARRQGCTVGLRQLLVACMGGHRKKAASRPPSSSTAEERAGNVAP